MTKEHTNYLIELRDSCETNMMGAGPYLQDQFGLDRNTAKEYLLHWMHNGPFVIEE